MIRKGFSMLGASLLYLISLLPFFILYRIADVLFIVLYYIAGYRRKVVQENLRNAFPEKTTSERAYIEKEYYKHLADLIVESIKLFTISQKDLEKHFTITNFDKVVVPAFAAGKSVIGAVGHYGNWEMAALKLSLLTTERRIIVYKPLSNPEFDSMFQKMRSKFGATLIAMKNTMRKLVEYRKERTITVLVSDQTPAKREIQHFTTFLNQPTAVFLGVEKLAKLTDSAVVFCDIRRIKRGYYNCNFVPLFNDVKNTAEYEITNAHVQYLEQVIKNEPQYWLWSHRRWKYKPEDMHK
ncbi:lysophospholipid acyltransferase family protein [Mucilaginibacter robiniae]|uniref:Lysophospholipid acyltransferase family protein n=1 Tax=Mucilaginibacter robiniae TaxID=2728022 RepID=A0A7L5ECI8_9SPHI|nr:lysophospholipid acyltransferase family protein [Mucilaginibacter robiniae]QJD98126.1 lysophospholipid acyltransferase family protein [Mucilaginibacter robiniae]